MAPLPCVNQANTEIPQYWTSFSLAIRLSCARHTYVADTPCARQTSRKLLM